MYSRPTNTCLSVSVCVLSQKNIFQVWGGGKRFSQNRRGGTKPLHTIRIQEKNERNLLLEKLFYLYTYNGYSTDDSRTSYFAKKYTNLQKDNDNRI